VNQVVVSEVFYVYVKLVTGMKSYELKKKKLEVVKQVDLKHVFKLLSLLRSCRVLLRLRGSLRK